MIFFSNLTGQLLREVSGLPVWALGFFFVMLGWSLLLSFLLLKQIKINGIILGVDSPRSIKEILLEQMSRTGAMQIELSNLDKTLMSMQHVFHTSIQKTGIIRFSPFEDTGGDQSFVLALLDASNSGIVVSSMHGRDRTRVYAKQIISGECQEYSLSAEEKLAIDKAIKGSELKRKAI